MFEHINCIKATMIFAEFGSGSRDEYKLRDKNLVLTKSIILLQMFSESACNFQASGNDSRPPERTFYSSIQIFTFFNLPGNVPITKLNHNTVDNPEKIPVLKK